MDNSTKVATPDPKNPLGDDWILLEIDGPGVRPENLDVRAALALAHNYVDLVTALADEDAADLAFTGLKIIDKCVAFAFQATEPDLARREAKRAYRCVTGEEPPPKGAMVATRAFREALRRLPPNHIARVIAGAFRKDLTLTTTSPLPNAEAQISLRATPLRAGGQRPAVRFESKSEERPFTLDVTKDHARQVGRFLYSEIDIVARVRRDEDGFIESGSLVSFEPVTDDDATSAWRDWYAHNASTWDPIMDVESELDRGRD